MDYFVRNEDGETAFDIASRNGDESMKKWVEEQDRSSKFASQLLDELEEDQSTKKKSKKKKKSNNKSHDKQEVQEPKEESHELEKNEMKYDFPDSELL
jgi:ankyrin repeat protein